MRTCWSIRWAVVAAILLCTLVHAESGDTDRQFGTNGITLVDFTPVSGAPAHTFDAATAVDAQGRVWAVASVQGSAGFGLGLARLTRNGKLDATFGSGGRIYVAAPAGLFYSIIGLRIGADDKVYAAYSQGSGAGVVWNVCRIEENGSFDPTFFGGCATPVPAAGAMGTDLQINPNDSSIWVLGSAYDTMTSRYFGELVVLGATSGSQAIDAAEHTYSYQPTKAVFDSTGTLYFTGTVTTSGNQNVMLGAFSINNGFIQSSKLSELQFDVGGTLTDQGHCIAMTENNEILVGAGVDAGNGSIQWASAKFQNTSGYPLDATYGNAGKTVETILNTLYDNTNEPDFTINGCSRSAEGALNLIGAYSFNDPVTTSTTTALAMHRLHPDGSPDQNFGGDGVVPGIPYGIAYAGTVLDYLRAPNNGQHRDVPVTITPYGGTLVVGAISTRIASNSDSDLVIARVYGDGIFNGDFD